MYAVSQKDNTNLHTHFNPHQPILVIFGRDIAESTHCRTVICYPTSPEYCLCTSWENMNPGNYLFSYAVYQLAVYLNTYQPTVIIFVDNKVLLLSVNIISCLAIFVNNSS